MSLDGARVLLSGVVLSQPAGGVRRHNAELLPRVARELAERGARLTVLEGTQPIAFDLPDSIQRLRARIPFGPPIVRAAFEGRFVREHVRSESYALFHTAHFPAPKDPGIPMSLTIHDLRSLSLRHSPMSRRLFARGILGKAIESAACVLTVSETVRAEILERFRVPEERVSVVPNAADHIDVVERDAAPRTLLHVGHLEPRKNLELLVRAMAVDEELPLLCFAGRSKGKEAERLASLATELGVGKRIRFLGPFDDSELAKLYASAACVVLPSKLEGFGIAALEAQRARVPLAVAEIPSLREVSGEATPSFAVDDPSGCARAIRVALAATEAELEAARQRAGKYSWDESARRWVDAWERALSPRPTPRTR